MESAVGGGGFFLMPFKSFFFLLAKCYVVHWLTTRDYDLLLQTSEQVVIFRRDGFVASAGYSHNTTHFIVLSCPSFCLVPSGWFSCVWTCPMSLTQPFGGAPASQVVR